MSFGELLKKYKERERYSYQELATLTGIARQTIINWGNDISKPRESKDILKLAKVLGLSADETNDLLLTAHHHTLEALREQVEMLPTDQRYEWLSLLKPWEKEVKQAVAVPLSIPQSPNDASSSGPINRKSQAYETRQVKLLYILRQLPLKYYTLFSVVIALLVFAIFVIRKSNQVPPIPVIQVPGGEFQMGSDAGEALAECHKLDPNAGCQRGWFENEEPIHLVILDNFYIDQYEVTNEQFSKFLNQEGNQIEDGTAWFRGGEDAHIYQNEGVWQVDKSYTDHPVVEVSWYGARAYCRWRGGRLPTEAEWEKAARGTKGLVYPWGNTFDGKRTNFCDSNCTGSWANTNYDDVYVNTAPIGSYPQGVSPYGVHDLAGNVWEWVEDRYAADYYKNSPAENPTGPSWGEEHVVRGGAWDYLASSTRTAVRAKVAPSDSNNHLGFRCARSP